MTLTCLLWNDMAGAERAGTAIGAGAVWAV